MDDLIQFITGGAETFTPAAIVGIIVFCSIFNGICYLVGAISGGVRR